MWEHNYPDQKSHGLTKSSGTGYGHGTLGVDWDKVETDPDGSSVGFSDPGLSNPTESNDLFTSGWSFGTFSTGQSYIYSVDGIHVPPEFFWGRIDNGAGDLALNLLFFSATQSLRIREWRFIGVDGFDQTFAVGQVSQRAVDLLNQGSANAFATLDNSWSMINLISVQQPQRTQEKVPLTSEELLTLWRGIDSTVVGKCADFISTIAKITTGKETDALTFLAEGLNRAATTWGVFWNGLAGFNGAGGVSTYRLAGSPDYDKAEIRISRQGKDLSDTTFRPGIVGVIHEVIHVAARTDDKALSEIVRKLGITVIADDGKTIIDFPKDVDNRNLAFSGFWGQALKNHCSETASYQRAGKRK